MLLPRICPPWLLERTPEDVEGPSDLLFFVFTITEECNLIPSEGSRELVSFSKASQAGMNLALALSSPYTRSKKGFRE